MQLKVPLYISFLFVTSKFQTWNMVNYDHSQNTVRTWSEHGQNKVKITWSENGVDHIPNMVDRVLTMEHCHQFGGESLVV